MFSLCASMVMMTLFGSEPSKVVKWGSASLKLQMTSTLEVHRFRVLGGLTSLRQMTSTLLGTLHHSWWVWIMVGPLGSGTDRITPQEPPFLLFSNFVWTFFWGSFLKFSRDFVEELFPSSLVGYGPTAWGAFFGLCGYTWVLVPIYWRACLFYGFCWYEVSNETPCWD